MKLEEQVCGLELAKRLKELGIEQNSYWYWAEVNLCDLNKKDYFLVDKSYKLNIISSAFTVAELGEILPITVTDPPLPKNANPWEYDKTTYWIVNRVGDEYNKPVSECGHPEQKFHKAFEADTEANARAKMLIYLLENKFIEGIK